MKLTLSMDKETIEFAHKLAKESNDSISNMVDTFFKNIRKRREEKQETLHPTLQHLRDFAKGKTFPKNKKEMKDILFQKYLK